MIRSIRARDCDGPRRLLAVALSLLLVFRLLLGPAMLGGLHPGTVPICAGTRIVFLPLDGAPAKPGPQTSDPCPFFGFAPAAPLPAEPALPPRAGAAMPIEHVVLVEGRREAPASAYSPRAPPEAV